MARRDAIADDFLAAAIEPERWLGVLAQVADATRCDHAQIIGFGPNYGAGFNWITDFDAAALAAFDAQDLGSPEVNYRVVAGMRARDGVTVHEAHYDDARRSLSSDAYLDFVRDNNLPYGCQTNLRHDESGLLGFAVLRSERSGRTTEDIRAAFADLGGHATAAAALQVALERDGHRLLAGTFDAMGTACFVLDRAFVVRGLSAGAEALVRAGVMRLEDGRVVLPHAADDKRLGAAMTAMAGGHSLAGHVVAADGAGEMTLKLHRLPQREWSMGFAPAAILIVKRSGGAGAVDLTLLRDTCRLTVAEAEIALLMHAGRSRDAICAARGITRETLRTHLRSLFAKLGVNREAEAIHMLHSLLD